MTNLGRDSLQNGRNVGEQVSHQSPFSDNSENGGLTISNTIFFFEFLVVPGGVNKVTHGN